MEQQLVREYRKGSLSNNELKGDVQRIWTSLQGDSKVRDELLRQGILVDQIDLATDCPYVLAEKGQGLTTTEVLITASVHALSAGTYDILKALWLKWIAPRIKARVDDALGPPADS